MRTHIAATVLLCSTLALAQGSLTDRPVVFSNDAVGVFTLNLERDQSIVLPERDHGFFLITLRGGPLSMVHEGMVPKGAVLTTVPAAIRAGDGRFLSAQKRLTISNRGAEYRGLVLELLNPAIAPGYYWNLDQGRWDPGSSAFSAPISGNATFANPLSLNQAIAWEVQLLPGDALPAATGPDWLVVAINDLDLQGDPALRMEAAECRWFPAGPRPKLVNRSRAVAHFIVINFGTDIKMPPVIPVAR